MRCHSCNAPLSIEDEKCPYCGAPNADAVKHRQAMKRFSGEFNRTKSSVLKASSENAQKYVRIIIICVLAVLLLASFALFTNSWGISSAIQKAHAEKHADEYGKILDRYEADADALSFVDFYDFHNLFGADDYDRYQHYYRVASNYSSVFYALHHVFDEDPYADADANLEHLCDSVDMYYTYMEQEHFDFYEDTGMYDEVHLKAAEKLTERLEGLLAYFLDASEEEMESFKTMSATEKQLFIERSVQGHE